jgi:OmpA-OmpF porin, OOP family
MNTRLLPVVACLCISFLFSVHQQAVAQGVTVKRFNVAQVPTSGTVVDPLPIKAIMRPAQNVDFSVRAVDEKTKAAISAKYDIQAVLAKKSFKGSSSPGKSFNIVLTRTDTLVVKTEAKGYYKTEEILLVACDTCGSYEHLAVMEWQDSVFTDLKVNQAIRLDNVYFDQSSYVLRPESNEQLDKLLKTLTSNSGLQVEIAGHTDNVGDRRLNQSLSENRARVITNYLANRGIATSRLQPRGYGDTKPSAPNDSENNKKKNRRVEFVVLKL